MFVVTGSNGVRYEQLPDDGEHGFAIADSIAEPAASVSGAGGEDIVQCIEADGNAGGVGQAVSGRQHSRGVEDQQRMRKIAGAEDAYSENKTPERSGKLFEAEEKGPLRAGGYGAFTNE